MKRNFYSLILLLLLSTTFLLLVLASCGDTPDTPPDTPPVTENSPEDIPTEQEIILKKLRKGMTYSEISDIIGESGTKANLPTPVYYWRIKGQKLYVWFIKNDLQTSESYGELTCTKFEFRENLQIELGQTYDEVVYVLGRRGTILAYVENIYFWNPADTEKYQKSKYYIRFAPDKSGTLKVSNFGYCYDPDKLNSSMSYEIVCTVFASEGEKISIENQVYGWDFFGGTIVAEFESTNDGVLLFKQLDFINTTNFLNWGYNEICESLGTEGANCSTDSVNSNLYMWDTALTSNLYVAFDNNNIATAFSYEENIDFVEDVTTIEKALFIMGEPFDSDYNAFRWHTDGEMDIYMVFRVARTVNEKIELLEKPLLYRWFYMPHIPILMNGMSTTEVYQLMGEADLVIGTAGVAVCYWYVDEFVVELYGDSIRIYQKENFNPRTL